MSRISITQILREQCKHSSILQLTTETSVRIIPVNTYSHPKFKYIASCRETLYQISTTQPQLLQSDVDASILPQPLIKETEQKRLPSD